MMNRIENTKTYLGKELETIFFRPMLQGENAVDLGVRVLYNMPAPVTLHFWRRADGLDFDPQDERQQLFVAQITKYAMRNID